MSPPRGLSAGGFWPRLAPDDERAFREDRLRNERQFVDAAAGVIFLALLAPIPTDIRLAESTGQLLALLASRVLVLALCVLSVWGHRRISTVGGRDLLVTVWILTLVGVNLFILAGRPPDFIVSTAVSAVVLLSIFVLVPLPLPLLLLPVAMELLGDVAVLTWARDVAPSHVASLMLAFGLAVCVGGLAAWRLNAIARERFLAHRAEVAAAAELAAALEEIRVLQGIIPICAHCRKVRSDDGFWEQVETYVQRHTDAKFSHGLCPECIGSYFPPEGGG